MVDDYKHAVLDLKSLEIGEVCTGKSSIDNPSLLRVLNTAKSALQQPLLLRQAEREGYRFHLNSV